MNPDILNVVTFGLIAVMVAALILFAMVHFELGPNARLASYRRWLLAAALGSGVLAFMFKLGIIYTIANYPQLLIASSANPDEVPTHRAPAEFPGTPSYRFVSLDDRTPLTDTSLTESQDYVWQALPRQPPAPASNPTTPAKVVLGEKLFSDKNLSRDRTLSCASCHDVNGRAGTDGRSTSLGIDGQTGKRNAPTVWNAAFQSVLFWDGRAPSLEEQAKGPLTNPIEMGMPSLQAVEQRVQSNADYSAQFDEAFGVNTTITIERIAEAIAAYERTLITPDTPYDRFVRGDRDALTSAQLRGMALFQSVGCINCHFGPNFSAASIFDSRMPLRIFPVNPTPYEQRYNLTMDKGISANGRGVWRVPSLRNVALTGPWFHNGSVKKLDEAVRVMASSQLGRGGHFLKWSDRDKVLTEINRPALSDPQVQDIVAFLQALSSDTLRDKTAKLSPTITAGR